jgi:ABC-type antimicrobial peptide transport system permease subunit
MTPTRFGTKSISLCCKCRTNELGVRSALGASRWQIMTLVMRHGMGLAGVGLIVGLPASVMLTGFMGSFLYGVGAGDPLTLVVVTDYCGS